ncbi:MAG TPA: helix-turn-helix domain-containing protein [Solirubrobacter sp.]|nr:helix-turn-helix domain-containing protein [Solirubrobacter sp.]
MTAAFELPLTVRRPQRADARRNFDALLAAARDAFAEQGTDASLEDIARRANVGIGTLYRNFPTRQDLFMSVYIGGVEELCQAAHGLEVETLEPWEAFAAWVVRFTDYVATKLAMKEALGKDSEMFRTCRRAMVAASEPLFKRAQDAGAIRGDIDFDDVLRMISGIVAASYVSDEQRDRVLAIALDGLRATR